MRNFLSALWRRTAEMRYDCRAIAATEFAVIVPLMLVMFFGTVEFSSGVAVDRKLTIVARTLSDLTSQSPPSSPNSKKSTVDDSYLQNVFTASIAILQPYSPTPVKAQLSEIYVDSNNVAKVQWSKAATIGSGATQATLTTSTRTAGDVVTTLPAQLSVKQTYLIFSEVSYLYTPIIGYVMAKTGVNLKDVTYTRPRQVVCVVYNGLPAPAPNDCPTP
jgi:Flp pilus assembly protein TadG